MFLLPLFPVMFTGLSHEVCLEVHVCIPAVTHEWRNYVFYYNDLRVYCATVVISIGMFLNLFYGLKG